MSFLTEFSHLIYELPHSSIATRYTPRYRTDMTENSKAEKNISPSTEQAEQHDTASQGPTLFIRMDRIGDLVLTLPADSLCSVSDDSSSVVSPVDWWIAPNLGFIADHSVPRRRVREIKLKIDRREFKQLLRELKARSYQTAVVFHAPWWVSPLLWLARIPNRVGVKSQWHSFLFLNKSVRQKRSLAEMSEFAYNMRLVEEGLGRTPESSEYKPLTLAVNPTWQAETLGDHELEKNRYSVVHPGMGGSAQNWPTSHYITWLQEASRSEKIVITGTATDQAQLEPIREALAGVKNVTWLDGKLSGPQLLHVLEGARCILAPSTGVAHLAASLKRPVIGLYSRVRVQSPKRWAPQGEKVHVLVPEGEFVEKKPGKGNPGDQMDQISIDAVRALWK
ncbi:MAG: glycosyltransferase family 9 protein [Bdellovibrionales bacterium]|jgi:ADP-heptose:LPS heptosyltransferase|nr:glycosyltransferase family 9 protein [Bdellovibrionales bacterium]